MLVFKAFHKEFFDPKMDISKFSQKVKVSKMINNLKSSESTHPLLSFDKVVNILTKLQVECEMHSIYGYTLQDLEQA